jgi:oligopeptide/dipeptide ABC transporter ATP-binding protein
MTELLSIRGLSLDFRSLRGVVKALDGVDLTVHQHEIVGLVGESGCGKTVTGLSVLRLLPEQQAVISQGEILFEGEDLLAKSVQELPQIRGRRVSMVFQDPLASLNPVFTVGEQIQRVIREHKHVTKKEATDATRSALAATGLPTTKSLLRSYPHQLSGGMRQRVCMAMAISCGSQLLIADEPTTALDVTIQAQLLRLLLQLRDERDLAQILITHNVAVAAQTCDRVAVMYAGTVVEQGPTTSIMKNARHPYTVALYECLPHDKRVDELRTIPGVVPDLIDPPAGCRFHPRCSFAMDICTTTKPLPTAVTEAHWAACHYVAAHLESHDV